MGLQDHRVEIVALQVCQSLILSVHSHELTPDYIIDNLIGKCLIDKHSCVSVCEGLVVGLGYHGVFDIAI